MSGGATRSEELEHDNLPVPRVGPGVVLIAAAGWHDEAPGGANKLPTDFARFLAGRGYRVVQVCPSSAVDCIRRDGIDGVDLRRYPAPAAPSPSVTNARQHVQSVRAIVRTIRSERPVFALLGHAPLQYLAAASACGARVRRCYGVHSPFAAELREGVDGTPSIRQRLSWLAASALERAILSLSHVVHCDSAYTRQLMASMYPRAAGKTIVLPGWVDTRRFDVATAPRDSLREHLGTPWQPGVPTFFSLRRLVPRMGLDALIDAAAVLSRQGLAFRLVVAGEGPQRAQLEALAAACGVDRLVAFLGRVPDDRVAGMFRAADCFVLPTRALECFGLIVLESFACGVPVIGVPVGAIPEVMGPECRGWIADDNGAAALAHRMRDFLEHRLVADPAALRRRAMQFEAQRVLLLHERALLAPDQDIGHARAAVNASGLKNAARSA